MMGLQERDFRTPVPQRVAIRARLDAPTDFLQNRSAPFGLLLATALLCRTI
jgi:hypothetical protein